MSISPPPRKATLNDPSPAGVPGIQVELPRAADAGRRARRFVEEHFGDHLSEDAVHNAKLVVSELANNAVLHGDGDIILKMQLCSDGLRIEVVDQGTGNAPAIREHADDAIGGRGLQIVRSVSQSWGVYEGTTHVWAHLPRA